MNRKSASGSKIVFIIINVLILNAQKTDVAFGQPPSGVAIRASPLTECFQKGNRNKLIYAYSSNQRSKGGAI
jgi:hypothetical protein